MREDILEFYKRISMYTNYSFYKNYFITLPNDLKELTKLVNDNYIHRVVLLKSYRKNSALCKEYPWYRYRCDDDVLLTVPAIMGELFRLDARGLTHFRQTKDKIVITCRYASVLFASILKAKGYSVRVRSGFAPYINEERYPDHWICEVWSVQEKRWVLVDTDEIEIEGCSNVDVDRKKFYFAANAWLDVRRGKIDVNKFLHGSHIHGLSMLARTLFFDFHSLMLDEISYLFFPTYIDTVEESFNLSIEELKQLDDLAVLLLDVDTHFDELRYLFENDKKFRCINTPLTSDKDHLELEI